jgi:dTDP-4-amino-4,6-dideoxy-D-glucose acyltransferase
VSRRIHSSVLIFGEEHVEIGTNVRIDAHCIITAGPGRVTIGDNVHIGAATHLFGTAGIEIADFANVSSRVSLFSTNDDYTGGHLSGPMVPDAVRRVHAEPVVLGRHALVGCASVVLPGVTLGDGGAVGALSLVRDDVKPGTVVAGTPAREVAVRDLAKLRSLEQQI